MKIAAGEKYGRLSAIWKLWPIISATPMTYTSEQIELMDFWLLTIIKLDISFKMFETFAQKQNISLELSNWTYYNVISVGHELGILNGYKSPSGKWKLIKIDKISCENFIEVGGFRKHFADIDNKFNIMQNFNLDQSIKVDNQSSLLMADNKPAIQKTSNKIEHIPPKRSWLEIASWTFGIIIAIIGIYEFIIKILITRP